MASRVCGPTRGSSCMKIVEIRGEMEFGQLKREWETLLADSASATIFLTWEWLSTWWSCYGKPGELRILLAYDDSGTLRGIAPLRAETVSKYGQSFPTLSFI